MGNLDYDKIKEYMGDEDPSVQLMTKIPMDRLTKELSKKSMSKKQGKKWYESRTMWLSIVALMAGIGFLVTGDADFKEVLLSVVGMMGIYLRLNTDKKIIK